MTAVYVLLFDGLGTTRSYGGSPTRQVVATEEEAKAWVAACTQELGDYARFYEQYLVVQVDEHGVIKEGSPS